MGLIFLAWSFLGFSFTQLLFDHDLAYAKYILPIRSCDEEYSKYYKSNLPTGVKIMGVKNFKNHS